MGQSLRELFGVPVLHHLPQLCILVHLLQIIIIADFRLLTPPYLLLHFKALLCPNSPLRITPSDSAEAPPQKE